MEAKEPVKGENIITSYYPNGEKESEGQFKDGMMVGLWATWYENGQMKRTSLYKDNNPDGKQSLFDGKGDLKGAYRWC